MKNQHSNLCSFSVILTLIFTKHHSHNFTQHSLTSNILHLNIFYIFQWLKLSSKWPQFVFVTCNIINVYADKAQNVQLIKCTQY